MNKPTDTMHFVDLENKDQTDSVEFVLNCLAQTCHGIAKEKGFHQDDEIINSILAYSFGGGEIDEEAMRWFASTVEQAEIARMHSELSEWLEGIRKGQVPDQHLPEFSSSEVEAADLLHRLLDSCAKRSYRIGPALIAKMKYNASRPRKHGKNS